MKTHCEKVYSWQDGYGDIHTTFGAACLWSDCRMECGNDRRNCYLYYIYIIGDLGAAHHAALSDNSERAAYYHPPYRQNGYREVAGGKD